MKRIEGILELMSATGMKVKIDIISKYSTNSDFKRFLYYALNPLITYNISEKSLNDNVTGQSALFTDIFECCEYLSRLRGLDDATLRQVIYFINSFSGTEKMLYKRLLSKTLRLGVTAKTVNKVIPNLIPEWEVQQAFSIEKYPIKEGTEFWLSQKLNGVRAIFYKGSLISRSGTVYSGLEHITGELNNFSLEDYVLDGELTLKQEYKESLELNDNEAFRKATGIINADKNVNKTMICFTIFDIIPLADFESLNPKSNYSIRRTYLDRLAMSFKSATSVNFLPCLYHGTDVSKIDELLDVIISEDKEGLMVNLDVPYKRMRHNGILKVKRFYTIDLKVTGCIEGAGRLAGTLGSLVVDYKNNEVNIGSGFTDSQRKELWNNRESIIGSICEIKYKEVSYDKKTSKPSLQFPVFVQIRDDKHEVSYD